MDPPDCKVLRAIVRWRIPETLRQGHGEFARPSGLSRPRGACPRLACAGTLRPDLSGQLENPDGVPREDLCAGRNPGRKLQQSASPRDTTEPRPMSREAE